MSVSCGRIERYIEGSVEKRVRSRALFRNVSNVKTNCWKFTIYLAVSANSTSEL